MPKNKMTIEDLAIMVQRGFEDTATKTEMLDGFKAINERFDQVEKHLDRMENILITGHDRRIEKLEDSMRQVLTALKI